MIKLVLLFVALLATVHCCKVPTVEITAYDDNMVVTVVKYDSTPLEELVIQFGYNAHNYAYSYSFHNVLRHGQQVLSYRGGDKRVNVGDTVTYKVFAKKYGQRCASNRKTVQIKELLPAESRKLESTPLV